MPGMYQVAAGVVISVKAGPSHDSSSTGLRLQPLQRFPVVQELQVDGAGFDGAEQVFLRLPNNAGFAFMFNRRNGRVVAERCPQHDAPPFQQIPNPHHEQRIVECPQCSQVLREPVGADIFRCPRCEARIRIEGNADDTNASDVSRGNGAADQRATDWLHAAQRLESARHTSPKLAG